MHRKAYGEPMSRQGTASDRVYAALRDDIVSWRIPAGTPLTEVELAERLGVSRTPLRAALTRLALEGLVDTSRGRTGVVTDMSARHGRRPVRAAGGPRGARRPARRAAPRPRVFAALAAEFDEAAEPSCTTAGAEAYYAVIGRFDDAIDAAIRNPALRSSLAATRTHLVRARRLAADNPQRLLQAAAEHAAICRAVAAGTPSSPRPPRPCTCARRSPRSSRPCASRSEGRRPS